MRRSWLVLLTAVLFFCPFSLRAEESFVLKERQWKEVYSNGQRPGALPRTLTFSDLERLRTGALKLAAGERVQIQGRFKAEDGGSFRLEEEGEEFEGYCSACRDRRLALSPRVLAPPAVVSALPPGLVRAVGRSKVNLERVQTIEPVLQVDADTILVPEGN